jgi:hypothetical protein
MTKNPQASKIKMDREGRFHLAQQVVLSNLKDTHVTNINQSSDNFLKEDPINRALPAMREGSTPVAKYSSNLLFSIMIAIAFIALSQHRKKRAGFSSNLTLDEEDDCLSSTPVSCKVHETLKPPTKPADTSSPDEPGARFSWPIHLPLKRITSFSTCGEIKTIVDRNSPESRPADKQQAGSEWAKKSVRWSPCVSVNIVENLHLERKGVEWENFSSSYWYNQLTAVPELQFQKYRMRIRREMQAQPLQWTPPSPPITSKARTRSC